MQEQHYKAKGAMLPFLKRLFTYSLKYPKWVTMFTICVLLVAAIESVFPLVWMNLLDKVIFPVTNTVKDLHFSKEQVDLSGLKFYSILLFVLGTVIAVCVMGFVNYAGRIQEYVMCDIRQQMFVKLQRLSFSFFDKSAVGWLLSRISSDAVKVTELVSWDMISAIWGTGMIVFCVTAMFIYNWKLAALVTLTIPVLMVVSVKIRILILMYSRQARKYNSEITASFNEHISGVEVNKSLVQEERVSKEFRGLSEKMRWSSYRSAYYSAIFIPLVVFIGSVGAAFVLYFGGNMVLSLPPEITIGKLAAFFGYATLIFDPILDITRFYSQAQNSISAGERIFSLIDTKPAIADRDRASVYEDIKGDIEFVNVIFQYEEGKTVIKNMNLKIEAGESVALVGETGGGKSTITSLICRFYEPTSGVIKIDGEDYKNKTLFSLRSRLGVVLQTPHLFSGTVRDNIRYGRDDTGDREIIDALELVGADDFIKRLDEEVGEGGENLSMGEKQLVSFARAVLANPRIFIMDEATSSIDTITEARIQKGILSMMEGRTSILIAHRLSTIKNCDRIIVISQGKIIEDGSHYELIKKKGYYYNLYTRQLREQREKEVMAM
jgi:ATP-binding cassette subfamily B protein